MCLEMAGRAKGRFLESPWGRRRGAASKLMGTSLRFSAGWRHPCCYSARRSEDPPQPSPRTRETELGGLSTGLEEISGE